MCLIFWDAKNHFLLKVLIENEYLTGLKRNETKNDMPDITPVKYTPAWRSFYLDISYPIHTGYIQMIALTHTLQCVGTFTTTYIPDQYCPTEVNASHVFQIF